MGWWPFGDSEDKKAFDAKHCQAQFRLAIARIPILQDKKRNQILNQRRAIAGLLRDEKYDLARVRVEQVIRDEGYVDALDLLNVFCDLVSGRMTLITQTQQCPLDLKEALSTIIWAAPRTDGIKELEQIRMAIARKYGKEWVIIAMENREMAVNQRVYSKLSCTVPDNYRCTQYLRGITDEHGKAFGIVWSEVEEKLGNSILPGAGGLEGGAVSFEPPPGPPGYPVSGPPAAQPVAAPGYPPPGQYPAAPGGPSPYPGAPPPQYPREHQDPAAQDGYAVPPQNDDLGNYAQAPGAQHPGVSVPPPAAFGNQGLPQAPGTYTPPDGSNDKGWDALQAEYEALKRSKDT